MSFANRLKVWVTTLRFRMIAGSLAGFLVASILSFILLNHILTRTLYQQLDRSMETEILNLSNALDRPGPQTPDDELARFAFAHGIHRAYARLWNDQGQLLAASDTGFWPGLSAQLPAQTLVHVFTWQRLHLPNRPAGVKVLFLHQGDRVLEIAQDLSETRAVLARGRSLFGSAVLLVLLIGSLLGWLAIRAPVRGIQAVSQAAIGIHEDGNLKHSVTTPTGSLETDQLATAFNAMLTRIQRLLQTQKEMMDNIAHDIRSPVARMRAGAESILGTPEGGILAGRVIEDCDRILNLINTLLDISAAEAGLHPPSGVALDWACMMEDALELFSPLIEQKELMLKQECSPNIYVAADQAMLQRVVANLLDNAVKYTPRQGLISLRLKKENDRAVLMLANSGPGIPDEMLDRIFERFFRGDASRSMPGSGLGLSFCRAAAAAMKGDLACTSSPGRTVFTLNLPLFNQAKAES